MTFDRRLNFNWCIKFLQTIHSPTACTQDRLFSGPTLECSPLWTNSKWELQFQYQTKYYSKPWINNICWEVTCVNLSKYEMIMKHTYCEMQESKHVMWNHINLINSYWRLTLRQALFQVLWRHWLMKGKILCAHIAFISVERTKKQTNSATIALRIFLTSFSKANRSMSQMKTKMQKTQLTQLTSLDCVLNFYNKTRNGVFNSN